VLVQACELFLSNRGAMCRYGLRQLKAESNASLYVTSMCRLFFTSLIDTATEFLKAFPQHLGCFSSTSIVFNPLTPTVAI